MFAVHFSASAQREFTRLDGAVQERFAHAIALLEEDPYHRRPGLDISQLTGSHGLWRLRVGDYRAAYRIADQEVTIVRVAHRSQMYRF